MIVLLLLLLLLPAPFSHAGKPDTDDRTRLPARHFISEEGLDDMGMLAFSLLQNVSTTAAACGSRARRYLWPRQTRKA